MNIAETIFIALFMVIGFSVSGELSEISKQLKKISKHLEAKK